MIIAVIDEVSTEHKMHHMTAALATIHTMKKTPRGKKDNGNIQMAKSSAAVTLLPHSTCFISLSTSSHNPTQRHVPLVEVKNWVSSQDAKGFLTASAANLNAADQNCESGKDYYQIPRRPPEERAEDRK